jgi:hypothetical protein
MIVSSTRPVKKTPGLVVDITGVAGEIPALAHAFMSLEYRGDGEQVRFSPDPPLEESGFELASRVTRPGLLVLRISQMLHLGSGRYRWPGDPQANELNQVTESEH